jgi:putative flippase GtrA
VKLLRFLLIGSLTLVIYYSILWLCFDYATFKYPEAVAIAYSAAIIFHFFGNRKVTFNANGAKLSIHIFRYFLLALLNYVIQLCVIKICYGVYKINFYISTFIGVILTLVTGFYLMKSWVFERKDIKISLTK